MRTLNKIAITAALASAIAGCAPKAEEQGPQGFELEGSFAMLSGDTAYLKLIKENGYEFVDSAKIDAEGRFRLKSPISRPDFYVLHFSDESRQITLVPDTCQSISISSTSGNYTGDYSVSGSPESEMICALISRIEDTRSICDSLGRIFRDNINAPNLPGIKSKLDSVYNATYKAQRAFSESFINEHPNALAQIVCLSQYIAPKTPVFDPEKDLAIYKGVAERLSETYPDNLHTKKLVSYVDKIKTIKADNGHIGVQLQDGDKAPDIALKNLKGETIRLSSIKGKYIILDFWASWSDVARRNSENLNKLYWKYYNNNIAVYQVALEESSEKWREAAKAQKLPWTSVSDLKLWESQAAADYGVRQLPATFIIYPDFTVHNVSGMQADALDAKLQDLVGKPIKKAPAPAPSDTNQENKQ